MSDRSIILDKIIKKTMEIQSLEEKIKVAKVYVETLKEVVESLESDPVQSAGDEDDGAVLRAGSAADMAREAIRAVGRPMHIDELMKALGRESNRRSRAALASALSAYVRHGEVFTRPSPNTFGLVVLNHFDPNPSVARPMPSPNFGKGRNAI